MKANELRIGNMVKIRGNICKVANISGFISESITGVMIDKHGNKKHLYPEMNDIESITITEEWLLRARFIKSFAVTNFAIQTEDGVLDLVPSSYEGYHVFFEDNWICTIQYVHQLQNLYFALTGQELIINL